MTPWVSRGLLVVALFVFAAANAFADPPRRPGGRATGNKHVPPADSKPVSVPEPTTLTLLALGAGGVGAGALWLARRKARQDG